MLETHSERQGASRRSRRKQPAASAVPLTEHDFQHEWRRAQRSKQRPSIAEFPNAECRNRGLHPFRVRGLKQAKATTLWYALTFNLRRMLNLGGVT